MSVELAGDMDYFSDMDADAVAGRLLAAHSGDYTIEPLTDTMSLTLEQAYQIQRAMTARRIKGGQRVIGWKLGYTSLVMREQMGIAEPNFGPLTNGMLTRSGASTLHGLVQPRVEPEVGLWIGRRLRGAYGIDEVLDACDRAVACLEVVDSVFAGYRFRLEDNTADGSSAAQVVLGDDLPLSGLDSVTVRLDRNAVRCGEAAGSAAYGHPAAGVGWLAARLAEQGDALEPGQLVITGGLTAAVPMERGDEVRAYFTSAPPVTVHRPW